jgi:hypothetical protein
MASGQQQGKNANIQAAVPGSLHWKHDEVQPSLDALLSYVEIEAEKATRWYWVNKKWKARLSRWIRLWALILTASAGLLPIASYIAKDLGWCTGLAATSGLWASALVGVAAALLGMDRAFGFSTGWARYVLAATEIRNRLEEFRMDWIALMASASPNPNAEQVSALIMKAKAFRLAVENVVTQETKDWVTEFQTNMAQLEKDVKAQLDALKAQVDRNQEARQTATQPGSIEATIENAEKTKDFVFTVMLDDAEGAVVKDERMVSSRTWTRLNVKPGQYRLTIAATGPDSKPISTTTVVIVKPSEIARPTVRLPIA